MPVSNPPPDAGVFGQGDASIRAFTSRAVEDSVTRVPVRCRVLPARCPALDLV